MKIVFITTVASSIYGFRAPVIKKLIGKNHQVYAFVSEFSDNELDRGLGSKNIKLGYFEASSLIFYLNLHAGG